MSYPIEVISVGGDYYLDIQQAIEKLNACQTEFRFGLPPDRLKSVGLPVKRREFHTSEVFAFLAKYCESAGGYRPFTIAVINSALRSDELKNLFGSRETLENPTRHFAVVTLDSHRRYVESRTAYLCYYLIRYSLSFVAPTVLAHPEAVGCFFDKKLDKREIVKSLASGDICDCCRKKLQEHLNPEIEAAVESMVLALKACQDVAASAADLGLSAESIPSKTEKNSPGRVSDNLTPPDLGIKMPVFGSSLTHGSKDKPAEITVQEPMKDFFVSYNRSDKQWAEWIAFKLEEAGYTTVIQAWDFRAGGDFVMEMHKAATGTKKTIAVLSENYLQAEYTQPEWGHAFARDPQGHERTLVPVRIATCKPQGLLATRIYIDLVGLSEEDAREKLLESLQVRGKPAASPAFPGKKIEVAELAPVTESPKTSYPGHASSAVAVWQEKLEFLQAQEPLLTASDQKFAIKKQIEEAEQRIQQLRGSPGASPFTTLGTETQIALSDNPTLEKLKELENRSDADAGPLRHSSLLGLLIRCLQELNSMPPKSNPYDFERFVRVIEQADSEFREGVAYCAMAKTAHAEIVACAALVVEGLTLVFDRSLDFKELLSKVCDAIVMHEDVRGETHWTADRLSDLYAAAIGQLGPSTEDIVQVLEEVIEL